MFRFGGSLLQKFGNLSIKSNSSIAKYSTAVTRETVKKLDTRKTFLVDKYTHILRKNPIVLVLHNNTLQKAENSQTRERITKAGGKLIVTRSNLFNVALRGLKHDDPASKEAQKIYSNKKHPLSSLFYGPTAIVAFDELNPKAVESVIKVLDRSGERLILLGGLVDGDALTRPQIDEFKTLPDLDGMRSQLAGVLSVLGGAGLVQTLEASQKVLYLTMDERRKMLDKND